MIELGANKSKRPDKTVGNIWLENVAKTGNDRKYEATAIRLLYFQIFYIVVR